MGPSPYRDFIVTGLLVAATALAISGAHGIVTLDDPGVRLPLPERVGAYTAEDVRFCQAEACLRAWRVEELGADGRCPECGGVVDEVSLAEKRVLPKDTVIRRREYVNPLGATIYVAVVIGGAEEKSLHRPQQCLPAQGHVIESERTLEVPVAGRAPLPVRVLELRYTSRTLAGQPIRQRSAYAYWFIGGGHETPYHLQRLWWSAGDRVLRGVAHRWAYVAVSLDRPLRADRNDAALREFIAALYPELQPAATR